MVFKYILFFILLADLVFLGVALLMLLLSRYD